MGARTADKLKEIEELRGSLASKLDEVERRIPFAGFGKKAAAAVAGTSLATPALAFLFRRVRGGKKKKAKKAQKGAVETVPTVISPSVNISVLPKGAAYLAAAGLAGFVGLKIYEKLQQKRNGESSAGFKPQVIASRTERQAGT